MTGRLHDAAGMPVAPSSAPGLLVVQIDGLSARRLRDAVATGRMPFVARVLTAGELELVPVYTGLPSTTPAVQAEMFYGVEAAVPAFTFVHHATGRLMRMYQHDAATAVESEVASRSTGSLLAGGASFANVFTGDAADARFCMASLGAGDVLPRHLRWLTPVVVAAYVPALVRVAAMAVRELATAPRDLLTGLRTGEDRGSELKFLLSRVVVGAVLRELSILGMSVDLARGLPVVHGNFLGYDENAHRRGPDSALALRALRPIDAGIARLWHAAHRSSGRAYDVWIVSDHGQERTDSYEELHGETVATAVERVAAELGIVDLAHGPVTDASVGGVGQQRARLLGERVIARIVPGLDVSDVRHEPGALVVTAQGPLGHVYPPRPLTVVEQDRFARAIVRARRRPARPPARRPRRHRVRPHRRRPVRAARRRRHRPRPAPSPPRTGRRRSRRSVPPSRRRRAGAQRLAAARTVAELPVRARRARRARTRGDLGLRARPARHADADG